MGSERGIAMIWWVIVLLVLFLAAAGFAYDRFSANEATLEENAKLKKELTAEVKAREDELAKRRDLSNLVGYKPDDSATNSVPAVIERAMAKFREQVQDPERDAADDTLEALLARAIRQISSLKSQVSEHTEASKRARSAEDEARATAKTQLQEKDSAYQTLQGEKDQVESRLSNTTQTKSQEIEELRGKLNTKEEEVAALVKAQKEKIRQLETERDKYENRAKAASARIISIRKNNKADGQILARVGSGNRVYVSVGSVNGLKEGTSFEVFEYAKGNRVRSKGRLVIQEVKPNFALAAITSEVDQYDPIESNDLIRNPLYQANKKPKFYLMGDMTGRFSNQQTAALIKSMGGEVVPEVTVDTDFVVLGRKESADAPEFKTREAWSRAQNYNIEIINADYLAAYFGR